MNSEEISEFDPLDFWLHERMVPTPWQVLSDDERQALSGLAHLQLQFDTLEERGRDRLDFKEVSVWGVREALARAYLAGTRRGHP